MNLTKSKPTADGAEPTAERGEMSSKLLLAGGGAIALVGAGALAFVLLSGGSDTPVATSALPTPSASATAPTQTASPTTSASIPTYAAKNARDPFKPLVKEGSGGSAGTVAPVTAPSSSSSISVPAWTPPVTTATYTPSPSPTSSTPSSTTTSPSKTTSPTVEPTVPYDVSLVVLSKIVDDSNVVLIVDDITVPATVGDVFGPFELKSVDTVNKKATVQYGEVSLDLPLHQIVILQKS
jgi:hypothetical protein